jgi:uncharacterized protein
MKTTSPLLLACVLIPCALVLAACQQADQGTAPASEAPAPSAAPATVQAPAPAAPVPARPTADGSPSFDCAAAASEAEKLVCSDPALAALDRRLAEVHARAKAAPGADQARMTAEQRGWAKGRDDCWKSVERSRCVSEAYMTRTAQLQIDNGETTVPEAAAYECDDNSKRFTVVYYNDLDPKTAVVTWGDDQALAFPMMAASGARYGREGMEIWEHQGELSVDFYGNRFNCRAAGTAAP